MCYTDASLLLLCLSAGPSLRNGTRWACALCARCVRQVVTHIGAGFVTSYGGRTVVFCNCYVWANHGFINVLEGAGGPYTHPAKAASYAMKKTKPGWFIYLKLAC